MANPTSLYDDGHVSCDDGGLTIRWYYLWGHKRIPWRSVRGTRTFALLPVRGRWRIWGSGDLVHWYNLDRTRPRKRTAIELDTGGRIRPTITPDDPESVARILADHVPA